MCTKSAFLMPCELFVVMKGGEGSAAVCPLGHEDGDRGQLAGVWDS